MKASSNSNILTTGLLSLSLVVLFSSCSKESVEPVKPSSAPSSERKMAKVEKPFSKPNSNEFGVEREITEVTPYTNNLSKINPDTPGGQGIANGSVTPGETLREPDNTDVTPFTNNLSKRPGTFSGNGEDFIQKENRISQENASDLQTEVSPYNSPKFKKRLIPSKL
jgi:hypothetical protein